MSLGISPRYSLWLFTAVLLLLGIFLLLETCSHAHAARRTPELPARLPHG